MKTMKIWRIAFAMFATVSLASCSNDPEWDNMVWHADVPVQITDGVYNVSKTGGEFTFSCRNYSGPWFSDAVEDGEQFYPPYINNPDYPTLQGKHFVAEIYGNKLTISFEPNTDSSVRNTSITVTTGDIFYTFNFKQFRQNENNEDLENRFCDACSLLPRQSSAGFLKRQVRTHQHCLAERSWIII